MKKRLDVLLVERGYFSSREKAKSSIMAGVVFVDNEREDKPGTKFEEGISIYIKEKINPYVSRGGLKLEKAFSEFNININGKTAMDIGASTGGFTDCMLKNGARKVYSVDVGYGQLAWELRQDERVVCMERTNIRYVKPSDIGELVDFCTIDVSFISLKKVIPPVLKLTSSDAEFVCLIKPQFEAGREKVGKNGVVRKIGIHTEVLKDITDFVLQSGLFVRGLSFSPIKGPEGNIEYLIHISKNNSKSRIDDMEKVIEIVAGRSHAELSSN